MVHERQVGDPSKSDSEELTLAGGTIVRGELSSRRPVLANALLPGWEALDINPRELADLMLASPLRSGSNLVALEPGPDECSLVVKRGTDTLGAFRVSSEVGTAAAVRLAAVAEIDPLSLANSAGAGASRRIHARVGARSGELLVCLRAHVDGIAAEVRPLVVNGRVPEMPRVQLRDCPRCGESYAPLEARCAKDGVQLVDVVDRAESGGSIGVYRLGAALGDGGMGMVLAGKHVFLGRAVAIKFLHRSIEQDPFFGRRFLAEARAASAIRHPNVVEILDYGLLADGRPYIVMERIEGEPLQRKLDRTQLSPIAALLLAREIGLALAAAHDRGVVHLDLKPANVILLAGSTDEAPRIKLIDFGAAAQAGGAGSEGGLLLGTPAYMAPEHARGDPADPRSDVYSLGVVLFRMLSGTLPFDFADPWRLMHAHIAEAAPPAHSPSGPLPEAVHAVTRRALKKKLEERHQTAAEFVADVDLAIRCLHRGPWLTWMS